MNTHLITRSMLTLELLAIELAKLGLNKAQKAIAEFKVSSADVNALVFTKDAKNLYLTKVGDYNVKCTADVRVAMATSATVIVSVFSFENDKKETVAYARFTGVE